MVKQSPEDYFLPLVYCPEELRKKNFLLLEGREHHSKRNYYSYPDTYVAKFPSYHRKDGWDDAHVTLQAEGFEMLTLRQFVDFLNLLKSGKAFDGRGNKVSSSELETILKEITELKDPHREERFDARFGEKGDKLYINYKYRIINGKLTAQKSERLTSYFKGKPFGVGSIDLNDYLTRATVQGMPPSDIKPGSLYYSSPTDGWMPSFHVSAQGIGLSCRFGSLSGVVGIRRVRAKE